jgi:hypothetical protein
MTTRTPARLGRLFPTTSPDWGRLLIVGLSTGWRIQAGTARRSFDTHDGPGPDSTRSGPSRANGPTELTNNLPRSVLELRDDLTRSRGLL